MEIDFTRPVGANRIQEMAGEIERLRETNQYLRAELDKIYGSKSWNLGQLLSSATEDPPVEEVQRGELSQKERGKLKKILVVDEWLPIPDREGGALRLLSLLGLLRDLDYAVTFIALGGSYHAPYRYLKQVQSLGVEVLDGLFTLPNMRFILKNRHFDIVILERAPVALSLMLLVRICSPRSKIIFDSVDLQFVRENRRAQVLQNSEFAYLAKNLREAELFLSKSCEQVWVCSAEEKAILQNTPLHATIEQIPNIHEVATQIAPFEDRQGIVFFGNLRFAPNEDGVLYFVREILPKVWKTSPQIVFYIVGSSVPHSIKVLQSERIIVKGHVKELDRFLSTCRLSVAPLRFGAGVKGKVGLSLAQGLPVVTTSVAAEGMDLLDGDTAMITNDVNLFAQKVLRSYENRNLWNTLSRNGLAHMASRFSPLAVRKLIDDSLKNLYMNC